MKNSFRCLKVCLLNWVLIFGLTAWLPAQTTWISATAGAWGAAANWSPATVPNATDAVVIFGNSPPAVDTTNNGTPFVFGTLISSNGVVLNGNGGQLNAVVSTGIPVINVVNSGSLWLYTLLGGSQGFNKTGNGEITFRYNSNNNPIAGPIIISGGDICLTQDSNLGNPGNSLTFSNNARLYMNPVTAGTATLVPSRTIILACSAANLDVAANNTLTIAGSIVESSPGQGLQKNSAGTLVLSGANTYTGTTKINAGKLVITTASLGGGSVSVADGATNQVQVAALGQTLTNSSLTLGTSAGATLEFNNTTLANPTAAMVAVNSLTLNGNTTVNIYGTALSASPAITLLTYTSKNGSGAFVLGSLPAGVDATLTNTGSQLQLVINSVGNPVSETVSFSATNAGYTINPAFCGLSYEKSQLTGSLFVNTDTSLISVFSQIGPAVLRIGGSSVDSTCWGGVSNLTAITPAQVNAFAGFVNALPTNWHVIYGINMIVNSPTNCAAEAAYVANALGSRLLGFEIGNEPDLYHDNTNYFPSNYSYSNFLPAWRALAAGITNSVAGWAITNGGNGWTLTGPACSYNTAGYTLPFATNVAGVISMVTQHYYRDSASNPTATMAELLSLDSNLPVTVSNIVNAATANHLPQGFRMDESGSFSGGGSSISSEYGAALWTLDVMFTEANNDCQGVNFHGGWTGTYSPIWTDGHKVVGFGPEFYGLKLFSLASQGSAVPAVLSPSPSVNFTAYGVRRTNGAMSAILLNKETNINVKVTINLGTNVAAAQTMTLVGPALDSTSGYTLGGATFNTNGSWAGGFQSLIPATNGQLTVIVLPKSALWLNPLLPPVLAAITNRAVIAGATLSITNQASDPNVPAQPLGFFLLTAPTGAGINSASGVVGWRPAVATSGTSNQFTVVVTNTFSLAATQSFWVGVIAPQKPVVSAPHFAAGHFNLTVSGDAGPDYTILGATNLASPNWQPLSTNFAPVPPFQWTDTNLTRQQFFYRVLLGP